MTEAKWWLTCEDPQAMLKRLRSEGNSRKLHLFAVACCRRIWHLLPNDSARREVERAERRTDGEFHEEEIEEDFSFAPWDRSSGYDDCVYAYATEAVEHLGHSEGYEAAAGAADQATAAVAAAWDIGPH